jgi:hypothetical protein
MMTTSIEYTFIPVFILVLLFLFFSSAYYFRKVGTIYVLRLFRGVHNKSLNGKESGRRLFICLYPLSSEDVKLCT